MLKLPDKEAKSLSFLTFSLISFIWFNISDDFFTKIVDLIVFITSFFLSALIYLKNNFKLPLFPCKNRCINNKELFCSRDKGFIAGIIFSLITVFFIKTFHILQYINLNKKILFFTSVFLTSLTIVHGTLRRKYKIFTNHDRISFIIGFLTALSTLFLGLFFIKL